MSWQHAGQQNERLVDAIFVKSHMGGVIYAHLNIYYADFGYLAYNDRKGPYCIGVYMKFW